MTTRLLLLGLLLILAAPRRIKLSSVEVQTFNQGDWAATRRNTPAQKLSCVGGSANCKKSALPTTVQCHNRGTDGLDVHWECRAILDTDYRLGKTFVTCEGYDYPEDPYILYDSCFLEYELDRTGSGGGEYFSFGDSSVIQVLAILFVCAVIYLIYSCMISSSDDTVEAPPTLRRNQRPPSYDDCINEGDRDYGYGWNVKPDSRRATYSNHRQSSFSGVFSHVAAGAAGFFAGRATSIRSPPRKSSSSSSKKSFSPSPERYSSTTYASTRRR